MKKLTVAELRARRSPMSSKGLPQQIFRIWRGLWVMLLGWLWLGWGTPTLAAESTLELIKPMSYSNAELQGKNFSNQDLRASDFANANMDSANFNGADLRGTIFSASILRSADLTGANLQFAMVDQVDFTQANLEDAILSEAILLRSTFENVSIKGADFTDAVLDGEQRNILCETATGTNSKTGEPTRTSLNCP
jgi:Pentapeptide repeats (8 copies)